MYAYIHAYVGMMYVYKHTHTDTLQAIPFIYKHTWYCLPPISKDIFKTIYVCMYICIYIRIHIYTHIYTAKQMNDLTVIHTYKRTTFLTICQMQGSTYVLAAIWGVLSLQYTHCLPWQTPPTCILSCQPHATTHSTWSDVRPWNTPAGSVVTCVICTLLLRHTQGESGEVAASSVCAEHCGALPHKHACKNGLWHPVCQPARCTWHNHACLVMANIIMLSYAFSVGTVVCSWAGTLQ